MRSWRLAFLLLLAGTAALAQPHIVSVNPDTLNRGTSGTVIIVLSGFDSLGTITFSCPSDIIINSVTYAATNLRVANVSVSPTARLGCCNVIATNVDHRADTLYNGLCVRNPDRFPPSTHIVFPPANASISCADTVFTIQAYDPNGIDTMSPRCTLFVDSTPFTFASPRLFYDQRDSLIVLITHGLLSEGPHFWRMVGLCDTFSNCGLVPSAQFTVDTHPPFVVSAFPNNGATITDPVTNLQVVLWDSLSGVDSTGIEFRLSINRATDTLSAPPTRVAIMPGDSATLTLTPSHVGVSFVDGDTVHVCLHGVHDRITLCPPNVLPDYCWSFYIAIPPATEMHMTITSVDGRQFPLISLHANILDQLGRPVRGLGESNFALSENGTLQYPLAVNYRGQLANLDVVFIMDDTGSMSGPEEALITQVTAFTESLAVRSVDCQIGMIAYRDSDYQRPNPMADAYELFHWNDGSTLTNDVIEFQDSVATLTAAGGADAQENQLDAIMRALHSISFRPGARKVFIAITNDTFCQRNDGSPNCDAHWLLAEVIDSLISDEVTLFEIADSSRDLNHWYLGPGSLTEETGGAFYPLGADISSILGFIAPGSSNGYLLVYTSDNPVPDCNERGERVQAWALPAHATDTLRATEDAGYHAPCAASATIEQPLPMKFTSDPMQRIMLHIVTPDTTHIDTASILLRVADTVYHVGSNLTWGAPVLAFTPHTVWRDGYTIPVTLLQCPTSRGFAPLGGPLAWTFRVDLSGPTVGDFQPANGSVGVSQQPVISVLASDNLSGVDTTSILLQVSGRDVVYGTFGQGSPGCHWEGDHFLVNLATAGDLLEFGDSVCCNVVRLVDRPDYGRPNPLQGEPVTWCFQVRSAREFAPTVLQGGGTACRIPVESQPGARLRIFDLERHSVREFSVSGRQPIWDGRDSQGRNVPSGVYFYLLEGTTTIKGRVVVIR